MKKIQQLALALSLSPLAHAEVRLIFCANLQCKRDTPCGQMHSMVESKELKAMGVKELVRGNDYWGSDYQQYCKSSLKGLLSTSLVIVKDGKRAKEYVTFDDFGFEIKNEGLLHTKSGKTYKASSAEVRELMIQRVQEDFKAEGGKLLELEGKANEGTAKESATRHK